MRGLRVLRDTPSRGTFVIVHPLLAVIGIASCSLQSGSLQTESSAIMAAPVCRDPVTKDRRGEVCRRWACEGRDVKPSTWNGDTTSCNAGAVDMEAAERAVRNINLHRFIADVPPVVHVPAWTAPAQECALLAHANEKLSHTPPRDWSCWSDVASETSAVSLIANRSAPPAIGAFMEDPGNETTMGHRRWLLSEEIWRVGVGSTSRYTCVVVDGRNLENGRSQEGRPKVTKRGWSAWPPAGPVPMEVFRTERLDTIGWTVQSSDADLDKSSVIVTAGGAPLALKTIPLEPLEGSRSAIRFVPDGWTTEPDVAYAVSVRGPTAIDFTVEPVNCE